MKMGNTLYVNVSRTTMKAAQSPEAQAITNSVSCKHGQYRESWFVMAQRQKVDTNLYKLEKKNPSES